jgi:diguanylate cyclase (GGDEF)-like protein
MGESCVRNVYFFIILIISIIAMLSLVININRNKIKGNVSLFFVIFLIATILRDIFDAFLFCFTIKNSVLLSAAIFCREVLNPYVPIMLLFMCVAYVYSEKNFIKLKYLLLMIIPIISTIMLLLNSSTHLFYTQYNLDGSFEWGIYGLYVHIMYSYACIFYGFFILLRHSIKHSGFFSKQVLLFTLGLTVPIGINVITTFIGNLTPDDTIIFSPLSVILCWIAISKYGFSNISPIALRTVINNIHDSFVICDNNLKIIDFNKSFENLFSPINIERGGNVEFLRDFVYDNNSQIVEDITEALKEGVEKSFTHKLLFEYKNKYYQVQYTPIYEKNNRIGSIVFLKDVTEQIEFNLELEKQNKEITRLNSDLKYLAERDALTGLYNRRYFNELFDNQLNNYRSCEIDQSDIGVAIIDIDNYKIVNDTYGHIVGDDILKQLAKVINNSVRSEDVVCRYGGEEFVVMFIVSNSKDMVCMFERIQKTIEEFEFDNREKVDKPLHITVSIGVATYSGDYNGNEDDILKAADDRLYKAKSYGKNQVVFK